MASVANNGPNRSESNGGKMSSRPPDRSDQKIPDEIGDFFRRFPYRAMAEIVQQFQPRMGNTRSQDLRSSGVLPERRGRRSRPM